MKDNKISKYRILNLKAREIFERVSKGEPINVCNDSGSIDFSLFESFIYNSLETRKMAEVYEKEVKNRNVKGKFEIGGYSFPEGSSATLAVINVTFSNEKHRKLLYKEGFQIETGKATNKYVRYKRSAGSSRQGNCLFILEPLKKQMMKWTACGLELDKIKDVVSWESYISLTLSNMRREVQIPKEAILIIPDAQSSFQKEVIAIDKDGEEITAQRKLATLTNKIWDGQGLLDESVFKENELSDKGMMLLRNRFFKTCAFNTRLQAWFKDNGITSLAQLNDSCFTLASSISDIKLVITDSSLKYIKLSNKSRIDAIKAWLENVDSSFGLVKTEKKTKHFDGNMVQTSYQLINTLQLSKEEMKELLEPTMDYLWKIQSDPMYMRYYLKMLLSNDELDYEDEDDYDESEDDEEDEDAEEYTEDGELRKTVMLELLALNDKIAKTSVYSEFRQQIKRTYIKNLRRGKLLVDGTNATLFGSGFEMLSAIISKDFDFDNPKEIALRDNEIRITRFEGGSELLCARSPHITMGNLFIAKNNYEFDDVYAKYFNLTKEIVCVNCIGQELMDRLNGCDFDSDTMLVTNNLILLTSAKKNYDKFLVPVCTLDHVSKNETGLWRIDQDISNNKIGRIVNLSQWLNSIFWDRASRGQWDEELYYQICKLSVLSGTEIDKAKRDYGINAGNALRAIKDATITDNSRPCFMKYVKKKETEGDKNLAYDSVLNTSMQILFDVVNDDKRRSPRGPKLPLTPLLGESQTSPKDNDYRYRRELVAELLNAKAKLGRLRRDMFRRGFSNKDAKREECKQIESMCVALVEKRIRHNEPLMRLLIKDIDNPASEAQGARSLALICICSATNDLYRLISRTSEDMYELKLDPEGELLIHGYPHSKHLARQGHQN
ncbi:MAG: hypothetical protein IJ004_00535 [Clostridia bacterium]|nr:hypothetical protein [Clostridia bacterium]